MTISRYLLHIAYLGKSFFGAQRQASGAFPRVDDPKTVQGCLEMGLKLLNPHNDPVVFLSSRTDSGVHALNSTCHVDLLRICGLIYEPNSITICLNKYFKSNSIAIRVIRTYLVPNEFHSRHQAISRTYLYRFCVNLDDLTNLAPHYNHIPIEESDRCLFICTNKFDLEEMKKASKLFEGLHDFRTFMAQSAKDPDKITRRVLDEVSVIESKPSIYCSLSWPDCMINNIANYHFYDIYVRSKGFLYKQVRRIVSSLLAVGQGKITRDDIKLMLQVPSHLSWNDRIKTVPAHGLYLARVEYSENDRKSFKDKVPTT